MAEIKTEETEGMFSKATRVLKVGINTFATEFHGNLEASEGGRNLLAGTRRVKDAAGELYDGATKAGNKLVDNISGAEAQALVGELLAQQRRYNDILATRLAEALDRIEHLEQQVKSLSDAR